MKILVVCHGNINRSPACEAVLKRRGLEDVSSAGFGPPNRRASKKMRETMRERGYDLEAHRSRQIRIGTLLEPYLILYMDGGNLMRIQRLLTDEGIPRIRWPHLQCLGPWIGKDRIKDPCYVRVSDPEFGHIVDDIITASDRFADHQLSPDLGI